MNEKENNRIITTTTTTVKEWYKATGEKVKHNTFYIYEGEHNENWIIQIM